MRIIDLQRRLREVGRIRIGEQVATSGGRKRPTKLEVFRLTSKDRAVIDAAATHFGGTVETWDDAPDGQQWQVKTTATEFPVVVPPGDMSFSQSYEQWTAGGCRVRCDGRWDIINDKACHCDPSNRSCNIHTRLSVIIPDLPGLGLWRLDTGGYYAAVELGGVVDIVGDYSARGQMLPARLRLEQRSVKRFKPDGKAETRRFAVPVLDVDVHPMALGAGGGEVPVGIGSGAARFQPVPAELPSAPVAPVAEQVRGLEAGDAAPKPRANAATPIPATGAKARTAAEVASAGELAPPTIPARATEAAPKATAPVSSSGDQPATLADALEAADLRPGPVLKRAREIAKDHGMDLPLELAGIGGDLLPLVAADMGFTVPSGAAPPPGADGRNRKMWAMATEAFGDEADAKRKHLIYVLTGGRTESSKDLAPAEWDDLFVALEEIGAGRQELHLKASGGWELRGKRGAA